MPAKALEGRRPQNPLSSPSGVPDWYAELHTLKLSFLILSAVSPHAAISHTDLAMLYHTTGIKYRHRDYEIWRAQDAYANADMLVTIDLASGHHQPGNLVDFLSSLEDTARSMHHWSETAEMLRAAGDTSPYVMFIVGKWPLALTTLGCVTDGQIDVWLFA